MPVIQSVEAIKITLPFKERVCDNWGEYKYSNHGLVIIKSDEGITGIGEISFAWFGGTHVLCDEINQYWSPHIVGRSIDEINLICSQMNWFCSFSKRHLTAKAGVEMALWDLLGKTMKVPVYALLGGKIRDSVKLTGGLALGTPEEMAEQAKKRISEGYRELKLKIAADNTKTIDMVKAVRKAVGEEIILRVDCNMAWSDRKTALYMANALYEYGVQIIEQPFSCERVEDAAWLVEKTKCRILCDEGLWDGADAKTILQNNAADMLHIYVCESGGIKESLKIADMAGCYGKECTIGSMPEGKTGAAAALQIAAVMGNLSGMASDIRGFTVYADDVTCENLNIENGEITIPSSSGLGVTPDWDKLDYYKVR